MAVHDYDTTAFVGCTRVRTRARGPRPAGVGQGSRGATAPTVPCRMRATFPAERSPPRDPRGLRGLARARRGHWSWFAIAWRGQGAGKARASSEPPGRSEINFSWHWYRPQNLISKKLISKKLIEVITIPWSSSAGGWDDMLLAPTFPRFAACRQCPPDDPGLENLSPSFPPSTYWKSWSAFEENRTFLEEANAPLRGIKHFWKRQTRL